MGLVVNKEEKILVVAPHPDDESIGCGGLLALYGRQCDVLLLTDGRLGRSEARKGCSDEEIIAVRKKELEKALDIAGVNRLFCLDIPDSELKKHRKTVFGFDFRPYSYIFVPNSHEDHPDHKAANRFIKAVRFYGKTAAKVYEYEVWTPLRSCDVLIDIETQAGIKEQMISAHVSQIEDKDYLGAGMGLSRYRGISCKSHAAEAFYRSPASVGDKVKRLLGKIKHLGDKRG